MAEIPRVHAPELSLSVAASLDGRSPYVRRVVTVQPLLAEHCQQGGEEGSSKACKEEGLDMDHRGGRAVPLWRSWNIISEGGIINLVDKDAEERRGFVARIRLQLGVDLDDECGGDG